MAIGIAKHKSTGAHYFFRTVRHYDPTYHQSSHQLFDSDSNFFNCLSTVKRHKQLVALIDGELSDPITPNPLGLLFKPREDLQPKRVMTIDECLIALLTEFESVDARLLAEELFLASPRELRANCSKNSPAEQYDVYKSDFASEILELNDDFCVLVEPVQDWMCFRNFFTIGAALLANIQHANFRDDLPVLEAAGFYSPKESAYNEPVFVIPIKFYASKFLPGTSKDATKSNTLTDASTDYLLSLYMNQPEISSEDDRTSLKSLSASSVLTQAFASDSDVFISAPCDGVMVQRPFWVEMRTRKTFDDQASESDSKNINSFSESKITLEADHNIYLCVKQKGSQMDMAKKIVMALFRATQNLKDTDGTSLGLEEDLSCMFRGSSNLSRYHANSFVADMWDYLCFIHPGRHLTCCKYCGCCLMVAPTRGRTKTRVRYCNNSCRMQDKENSNG